MSAPVSRRAARAETSSEERKTALPFAPPAITPEQPKNPALTPEQVTPATTTPEPVKEPEQKKSVFASIFGKPKAAAKPKPAPSPEEIYAALDEWRKEQGRQRHTKPWYVLEDYTLKALSEKMPKTYDDLLTIPGIKEKKREQYGKSILAVLDRFRN
jgi:superfamily II DNA helicase RecQ